MFLIQIIGRLIQKQNVRFFQKQFPEQYLCSLSAAEFGNIFFYSDIQQSECSCNLFHPGIDHIIIMRGQKILYRAKLFHISIHLFCVSFRIRKRITYLRHSCIHLMQEIKCGRKNVFHSHSLFKCSMLIQISYPNVPGPLHLAFIRHQFICDNIHKRRLSFAICSDQSYVFTFQQSERYIFKNSSVAESMRQMFNI